MSRKLIKSISSKIINLNIKINQNQKLLFQHYKWLSIQLKEEEINNHFK